MKKVLLASLALAGLFGLSATRSSATTIAENFSTDPLQNGWQVFGNTNLFQWDSTNQSLDVTWDSSQPNSYFHHPLGAVCSKTNDFLIAFDLRLNDIAIGTTPGEPFTFEMAIGLIHTAIATNGNYFRGYGYFPDIVEFDYFPNDINDYGATVSTIMISSQTNYSNGGFTDPLELETNTLYHVMMVYTATNQTLHTTMAADGAPFGPIQDACLGASFDDFQVDAVSINSYSDDGQDPDYAGSILAHGTVDNIVFASPLPVGTINAVATGEVQFASDTRWLYTLEQTADFQTWSAAAPSVPGNGTNLVLQATNPPADKSFYRVRADLP
ncbi:MAG: hypothetical protein ACLQAH_03260 [Limisphaerales bacterium]